MPFICSLYFNFETKVKSYESGRCKGIVLPQKERSGCQRQLPCDGEIDRRKILRSGIQFEDVGDFNIIPIVVFSDSAELNITTPNHIVINWSNLRSAIKSYRTPCISPEDIQRIVSRISSANITTEGSRESHIRNVQTVQQNRDMAIANGKCPKCGGNLVERKGKYGSFLGCSNYPRCRFTHNGK